MMSGGIDDLAGGEDLVAAIGVSEFLLVKWIAPTASEAPELLVATLFAFARMGMRGLRDHAAFLIPAMCLQHATGMPGRICGKSGLVLEIREEMTTRT